MENSEMQTRIIKKRHSKVTFPEVKDLKKKTANCKIHIHSPERLLHRDKTLEKYQLYCST